MKECPKTKQEIKAYFKADIALYEVLEEENKPYNIRTFNIRLYQVMSEYCRLRGRAEIRAGHKICAEHSAIGFPQGETARSPP